MDEPAFIAALRRLRSMLKRKSGDKTFAEEWAEHKRGERDLDEAKERRNARS